MMKMVRISGAGGTRWAIAVLYGMIAAGAFAENEYRSPVALAAVSETALYAAEYTAHTIAVVDSAKGVVSNRFETPQAPGGIALSSDGKKIFVAGSAPEGAVYVMNAANGTIEATIPVGHTPDALALHPQENRLYVANRFTNDISVIDLAANAETARIPVLREPVALAMTPDGAVLFVANLLPVGPSDGANTAAAVSVIDTASQAVVATLPLPNGSSSLRGVAVSPDGRYAYITHILSRYQLPTTQLERGWMNTNAVTVIDIAQKKLVNTVLLDDVDLGAANPWAAACSADGQWLCITHAGSQEVSIINRPALHEKLDKVAAGERVTEVSATAEEVPNDLSFLTGLRRRVKLAGNGPRAMALEGNRVYVTGYFSDTMDSFEISSEGMPKINSMKLGAEVPMTDERKGEMFFNDSSLCFQHWQSCASCHPDARVDGLNWDLLNDGIGNPKNSKSMLFSHFTPPVMGLGIREDAKKAVRSGIKNIQFAVRSEEDASAVDAYLSAMKPVPSPRLEKGKMSESAQRGKAVFEKANCASCHSGEYYTDLKQHDLGTATGMDAGKPMDTPTLAEAWRTAPYLHDGRAADLTELFRKYNPDDLHGSTAALTDAELTDLIAYVLSL